MKTPQVILLGADTPIGLSVVRELGRHGVAVHAIGRSARSIGLYSRYAVSRHYRENEEDDLIVQLDQLGRRYACPWVMTISESDILLLQRRSADFEYVAPIVPKADVFSVILDKASTFVQAEAVGIRVPRSWKLDHVEQLDDCRQELSFPLVLKWANPYRVIQKLAATGQPLDKYRYVYSFEELAEYLGRFETIGEYPLLQEYCPGVGLGHMLFMHDGEAIQRFQHIRVAEWPPEGGVSAVCISMPAADDDKLMQRSIALLKRLRWEGPAMVEYRYDSRSGEACLMEINGRFWGSLPLAFHVGADFAWLTYQAGTGIEPQQPLPYRAGLRCRYFAPELKRLTRILFSKDSIQNRALRFNRAVELAKFIGTYFSPMTRYYVFSLIDPKPFFYDLRGMIKERLFRKS